MVPSTESISRLKSRVLTTCAVHCCHIFGIQKDVRSVQDVWQIRHNERMKSSMVRSELVLVFWFLFFPLFYGWLSAWPRVAGEQQTKMRTRLLDKRTSLSGNPKQTKLKNPWPSRHWVLLCVTSPVASCWGAAGKVTQTKQIPLRVSFGVPVIGPPPLCLPLFPPWLLLKPAL